MGDMVNSILVMVFDAIDLFECKCVHDDYYHQFNVRIYSREMCNLIANPECTCVHTDLCELNV